MTQYFDVDKEMAWYKDPKRDNRLDKIQHMPHDGRAVNMYDKKGNFIRRFRSCCAASAYVGREANKVYDAACGSSHTCGGYQWRFEDDTREVKALGKTAYERKRADMTVMAYDKSGNVVGIYSTVKKAASELKVSRNAISKVLHNRRAATGNYTFSYA